MELEPEDIEGQCFCPFCGNELIFSEEDQSHLLEDTNYHSIPMLDFLGDGYLQGKSGPFTRI